jgi:hypothetical protein
LISLSFGSQLSKRNGFKHNKGNNKITELRTILQRESQNSSTIKKKEAARIEYPGVKPIIHQSELRTYTKEVPFKENNSFRFVVL